MRTNIEGDWFRVYVGTEAEFITYNHSKDHAIDSVKEYCDENRFLGLDPTMMLPHGTISKPLQPHESQMYSIISNENNLFTPRLVNYRENSQSSKEEIGSQTEYVSANQLALFGLKTVTSLGLATKESDYSYFIP
ncbi:MAG: hypothetical protein H6793_04170 [Candidatus Nomurabacteria bacterium]|nr:MAG: hypothetical protein H6793_04170 [Candidatus Nomurabacteria bacterium]